MSLFDFNPWTAITFFAVLVRFSVLLAIMPWIGDRNVPALIKVLLAVLITAVLFPVLSQTGVIDPQASIGWQTASQICSVVFLEALVGVTLGYVARMVFMGLQIGGDLAGHLMGFSMASLYDPNQESQTQVIAKFQTTLGMLFFLVLDGHHLILDAGLQSYRFVGLGVFHFSGGLMQVFLDLSREVLSIGLQIAAPIIVSQFAITVVYAVFSKAMPQVNILVLSFSVSAVVGFFVLFSSIGEFGSVTNDALSQVGDQMRIALKFMKGS